MWKWKMDVGGGGRTIRLILSLLFDRQVDGKPLAAVFK